MTGWDGTGIDPWLPHRLAAETTISTTERNMYRAWWASFSDWLVQVQRSVMAGEQPDPNGVWSQEPDWLTRMADFVQGPVKEAVGNAYEALFGPGYQFDARPAVTTHLAQVRNRMVHTPETVFDAVAATIARGAGGGDSIPDIASRVSTVLTATGTPEWHNRAVTVARTESLAALNAGRADAHVAVAEVLEVEMESVWLSTLDARTRLHHAEADGQRVPVKQPFIVMGEPLLYPGDPAGSASNTINCRCSTLLVEKGEEVDQTGRGFTDADEWWDAQTPVESSAHHRDLADVADMKATVESGKPTREKLTGGEMAPVYRDTFPNGTELVEKTSSKYQDGTMSFTAADQADAENLVSQLGRALGAPVPRVYQAAPNKVFMDVAPGHTYATLRALAQKERGISFDSATARLERLRDEAYESDEGRALGLLDVMTDNWDRNPGNWTLDDAGRPHGLDHGLAWDKDAVSGKRWGLDYADEPPRFDYLLTQIAGRDIRPVMAQFGMPSPFADNLSWVNPQGNHAWIQNDFTPADMNLALARLTALRPEFEHAGRLDWYEFARRRLAAVAAHAKGTRDRLR